MKEDVLFFLRGCVMHFKAFTYVCFITQRTVIYYNTLSKSISMCHSTFLSRTLCVIEWIYSPSEVHGNILSRVRHERSVRPTIGSVCGLLLSHCPAPLLSPGPRLAVWERVLFGHAVVPPTHSHGAARPLGQEDGLWRPLRLSLERLTHRMWSTAPPPRATVGKMHSTPVVSSVSVVFLQTLNWAHCWLLWYFIDGFQLRD